MKPKKKDKKPLKKHSTKKQNKYQLKEVEEAQVDVIFSQNEDDDESE